MFVTVLDDPTVTLLTTLPSLVPVVDFAFALKLPDPSNWMEYVPGATEAKLYAPLPLVVAVETIWLEAFTKLTDRPLTALPFARTNVPDTDDVLTNCTCALSEIAKDSVVPVIVAVVTLAEDVSVAVYVPLLLSVTDDRVPAVVASVTVLPPVVRLLPLTSFS